MAFKAGMGRAEVRFPQEIFPLEGFKDIHDNPHIRVLLLESSIRTVIAAVELVNVTGDGLDTLRAILSRNTGAAPEHIFIHITHAITTPHIPNDPDKAQHGPKNEHMDEVTAEQARHQRKHFLAALTDAAEQASREAAEALTEVRLGYGTGSSVTNINRDYDTPFGRWIKLNPDAYSDHELRVLRIERTDGSLMGILVNFGLKPCAVDNSEKDSGNRLISSDVPGLASTLWEQETGAVCIYTMSAAGDQVPREQALLEDVDEAGNAYRIDLGVEKGFEIVSRLGPELAADISAAAAGIACSPCDAPISVSGTSVVCGRKGRMPFKPRLQAEFVQEGEVEVTADLITFGNFAIVTDKPETNAVTGRQLKDRSPYPYTFFLSMTNGDMKYMPDQDSYDHVSWESQSSMLMPGSAEKWLNKVIETLTELKGKR